MERELIFSLIERAKFCLLHIHKHIQYHTYIRSSRKSEGPYEGKVKMNSDFCEPKFSFYTKTYQQVVAARTLPQL